MLCTYRHQGIGDIRLCTAGQGYLVNYASNYWPTTFKGFDPATRNLVYEVSFLVEQDYVTDYVLPDASGRYSHLSMAFGGFRETGESFKSIFDLVAR